MKYLSRVLLATAEALVVGLLVWSSNACSAPPQELAGVISITTLANAATITSLPTPAGNFELESGATFQKITVRLYRDSDKTYWNGTAWINQIFELPASANLGAKTWQCTATLPTGSSSATGLAPGNYGLKAVLFTVESGTTHDDKGFVVGVVPPPITVRAYGWGYNGNGEVGAGPGPSVNQPTKVSTSGALEGKTVIAVASGAEHTMALTSEGKVYTWGYNGFGELGRGSGNFTSSDVPVPVDTSGVLNNKRVVAIGAGDYHSFAITSDNQVFSWGRNDNGELGNGVTGGSFSAPVAVNISGALAGKRVLAITGGDHFTIALTFPGNLYSWGDNTDGQLGTGNNTPSNVPVAVAGLSGKIVTSVEAGVFHALALTTEGKVYAFGRGAEGRLGNGGVTNSNLPILVGTAGPMAGKEIIQISASRHHSLALSNFGRVYSWGSNAENGLGDGGVASFLSTPIEVGGNLTGKSVFRVGTGWYSSYAFTRERKMFAWGNNHDGNLAGAAAVGAAVPSPTEANTAGVISITESVATVVAGWRHAVMLTAPRTGNDPDIVVEAHTSNIESSGQINLGSNGIGSSNVVAVTIRNRGVADLTGLSFSFSGSDYFVDSFPQSTLAPNASMQFNVTFIPSATGTRTGSLTINSNDPDESEFTIGLTGTGLPLGDLAPGFGAPVISGPLYASPVQTDGKILLGGIFSQVGGVNRNSMARLTSAGALDTGFDPNVNGQINCIAIQRDGRIVIGGAFTQVGGVTRNRIARLETTGALDTSFNPNVATGVVNCLDIAADGTILVGGSFDHVGASSPALLVRLFSNGAVDPGFNPIIGGGPVRCVARQSGEFSNLILIGGSFSSVNGQQRVRLARLETDGFIDSDFTADAANGFVYSVAMLPDGRILAAGEFDKINNTTRNRIVRLSQTGVVDSGYDPNVGGSIYSMALQADGGVLIGGTISSVGGTGRSGVARLKANGSLDLDFDPVVSGGPSPAVNSTAIQADGKILLAGVFTTIDGITRNNFAQLTNINASQTVVTNDPNIPDQVRWFINDGSPQTTDATLEKSTNGGANWTSIGPGTRLFPPNTGWQWLSAGSLPTNGLLRLRAAAASGYNNGSSSVIEKVFLYNGPPAISVSYLANPLPNFSTLDFGAIRTGAAASRQLTITNTGGTALLGLANATTAGTNADEFELELPNINILNPGASTSLSVVYKPRTQGTHVATLVIPNNSAVSPSYETTLTGIAGLPIGTWRQQYFGQTENNGNAGNLADPDGDGRSNLLEFAQGLNPNAADVSQTSLILSNSVLTFTYTRSKLALADVTFQVEWSDPLTPANWQTTGVLESVILDNGFSQTVQATLPQGSAGHRFVRLRVSLIPQ